MQRALTIESVIPYQKQTRDSFPQFSETIAKIQENAKLTNESEYPDPYPYILKFKKTSDITAFNTCLNEFLETGEFPNIPLCRTIIGSLGWLGHMDYAYDIYKIAMQEFHHNSRSLKLTTQILLSAAACQRHDIIELIENEMRFFHEEEKLLIIDRVFKKDTALAEKLYEKFRFRLNSRVQLKSESKDDFEEFLLTKNMPTPIIDLHHELSASAYLGLKKYIMDIPLEPARDVQFIIITGRGLHSRTEYEMGRHPMRLASEQICHDLFQENNYQIQDDRLHGSFLLTVSTEVLRKIQLKGSISTSTSSSSSSSSVERAATLSLNDPSDTNNSDTKTPSPSSQHGHLTPSPRVAEDMSLPKVNVQKNQDSDDETSSMKPPAAKPIVHETKNKNRHHKKKSKEKASEVSPPLSNPHSVFGIALPTLPTLRKNPCKMFQDKIGEFTAYFSNLKKRAEYAAEKWEKIDALLERQAAQREEGSNLKKRRMRQG